MTIVDSSPWAGWVSETLEDYHNVKGNEMTFTSETMRALLANNKLTVNFTKKNGEKRVMTCTTIETLIPEDKRPKTTSTASNTGSAVRAFDLNKNEWRSFLAENVNEVTIMA